MNLTIRSFASWKKFVTEHTSKGSIMERPLDFIFSREVFNQVPIRICEDKHGWVGKEGVLLIKSEVSVMTMIHEACHYFLCEPERLKYNDFGLGLGSESYGIGATPYIANSKDALLEEEAVCLMSTSLALDIGLPPSVVMGEMKYANMVEKFTTSSNGRRDHRRENDLIKQRNIERFGFKVKYLR